MAYISASILHLDLAGGEFDWMALDGVFHVMVQGCVWFDLAVGFPSTRQTSGLSLGLCTILVSYSGEISFLGAISWMMFCEKP